MEKKILHILASNKFSGAENVVCQIIDAFKNDKNVSMAYASPNGRIADVLKKKNIEYIPMKKMDLFNVKKIIKEYNPDIIHAHDFRASVLVATSGFNKKIISHLHCNPLFIKKWGVKSLSYFAMMHKFSNILVVSKAVLEEAVFLKGKAKEKVTILNNCTNKDDVLKKANAFEVLENYDIAFIGRLSLPKNPIKLIDIIGHVNELKPGIKAVIIGDGEEREKCEEYIKEKGLENVITLKGFLENPFPYLKKSKVTLMPSIFEGFGLVAIESMIVGTPVLNSGVGGLATIFEDDSYFICDDIDEYAKKAIEILEEKEKFNFEKILNKYTNIDGWKKKLVAVYK